MGHNDNRLFVPKYSNKYALKLLKKYCTPRFLFNGSKETSELTSLYSETVKLIDRALSDKATISTSTIDTVSANFLIIMRNSGCEPSDFSYSINQEKIRNNITKKLNINMWRFLSIPFDKIVKLGSYKHSRTIKITCCRLISIFQFVAAVLILYIAGTELAALLSADSSNAIMTWVETTVTDIIAEQRNQDYLFPIISIAVSATLIIHYIISAIRKIMFFCKRRYIECLCVDQIFSRAISEIETMELFDDER